jgi:radical SAM superfamily enzyme YgiQ (UPF0313 family)
MQKKTLKHIKQVRFWDNILFFEGKDLDRFVNEYKNKVGLPFECNLHPEFITKELVKKLKKAGMNRMSTGIQEGSEKVRFEILNRRVPNKTIMKVCKILQSEGITPNFDIIVDNPLVTEKDMKDSFNFLIKLPRPFTLTIYSLNYFPKTELTEKLLDKGIITKENIEGYSDKSISGWRFTPFDKVDKTRKFWNSLYSLISKRFIPKSLLIYISKNRFLRKHPYPVVAIGFISNTLRVLFLGFKKILRGEMDRAIFMRYINLKRITSK